MHRGEKILVKGLATKLAKERSNDQLYNYYRSKLFIANETPLWKLIEVLNEAYNSEIIIKDPSIENETLTTTLKVDQTLEDNLETVCETLGLKMQHNQRQIWLSKNKW